jgi:hypothetical protein
VARPARRRWCSPPDPGNAARLIRALCWCLAGTARHGTRRGHLAPRRPVRLAGLTFAKRTQSTGCFKNLRSPCVWRRRLPIRRDFVRHANTKNSFEGGPRMHRQILVVCVRLAKMDWTRDSRNRRVRALCHDPSHGDQRTAGRPWQTPRGAPARGNSR